MNKTFDVKIESSWKRELEGEFQKEYFLILRENYHNAINKARQNPKNAVLPPPNLLFNAFNLVQFDSVKVVIIGQDPYHNIENSTPQANGLAFSVSPNLTPPPSLKNIFKEINRDLGIKIPKSGDLTSWTKQGVLLLNSILSVELNKPLSHKAFGWEIFTDKIIEIISSKRENIVFMLWGNYAKGKRKLIDERRHFILEAPHPSPLSRGFIGCSHFSKCNEILAKNNLKEINWALE
ncbi:uracil-DNA glycosylase [Helicobacter sp. 16-1353]|uniref:uracil-DNA glycosylase n=1 Tax=Helicobacter sp. 16-1353 TaxID=2004996 RepID=UPI000DCDCEDE|nr:uracil-DNA glycosylase [Helicobacter sp. 16-1353]RAX54642.1 uracil-DNA glycosylase [Helicobacter sp. 16-1353]